MSFLRELWRRLAALVELVLLIATIAALPAAFLTWLAILLTIGLLWSIGWLQ